MADPFEVRMRFTNQLRQLSASVTSSQKAAQYALRHKDLAEDLHSCILEQLERSNLNMRANIMYFIEHFLDMASKDGQEDYIRMMQRDIIRVVDAVAPDDGSGAANVKVVRKVLQALHAKTFLDATILTDIFEVLRERGESYVSSQGDLVLSPSANNNNNNNLSTAAGYDTNMPPSQTAIHSSYPPPFPPSSTAAGTLPSTAAAGGPPSSNQHSNLSKRGGGVNMAAPRLDKKQVEQRIEEDRERHKRLRENIWAVPSGEEMDRLLEETSELGDDDMRTIWEEQEEWERSLQAGIGGSGGGGGGAGCGHTTTSNGGGGGKNGVAAAGANGVSGKAEGGRNGNKEEEEVKNGGERDDGMNGDNMKEKPMSIGGEIAEMARRKQLQLLEKEQQEKQDKDVEMTSG
ncbi:CTD kinase subunit gamma CTK3-domain-containing protein [Neurospora hispaniola]|uniref:CTD kinase subunit gamma CTK3-domain-containing protein n=1 Tax=Neurospora hispaniola TaxID=588809 RepID=A0AAJ0I9G6_9PEZI|nr:CTD kinase subunit gamma CTK3-domain-containing protein [Neurospora hispaniola]